uniref:GAF domain-containing protein n=1 Tax=Roseihalotalea indica TaxID=2867963 RepID=A0AA49JGC3_9BACT|nr:GAF domain-containing protein [Tunicatimonas sp. TK19036]
MAENIVMPTQATKEEIYEALLPQLKALTKDETNLIANLGNIAAALHHNLSFFWTGFYLVEDEELVLGPFQGPVACTRIAFGKGVCGTAWKEKQAILVPDVHQFPGHIACSADSQSEIVVPVIKDQTVRMVLDIDSNRVNNFDEVDQEYLTKLAEYMASSLL